MKTSELIRLLKRHGIYSLREGTNHEKFYSPITQKSFIIWRHAKEIPNGTLNKILKDAGLK